MNFYYVKFIYWTVQQQHTEDRSTVDELKQRITQLEQQKLSFQSTVEKQAQLIKSLRSQKVCLTNIIQKNKIKVENWSDFNNDTDENNLDIEVKGHGHMQLWILWITVDNFFCKTLLKKIELQFLLIIFPFLNFTMQDYPLSERTFYWTKMRMHTTRLLKRILRKHDFYNWEAVLF